MTQRAIVSGSLGLVGFAVCERLLADGWTVLGIDNDQRSRLFGKEASTASMADVLRKSPKYEHYAIDIRSKAEMDQVFCKGADLCVHTAAQPSHDWSTTNIREDFHINAVGTLTALEAWHKHCRRAPFAHLSTSKVYGDNPNRLPLDEMETRYDLYPEDKLYNGIPEEFSTDLAIHSFFGVSKLSGDLLAQEYGRNFGLPVTIFRPGCVVGKHQKGVELHGFLSYLAKCIKTGTKYKIYGHKAKMVRCNVHADDLVEAILMAAERPKPGEVYCIGGRGLECSMMEAISELEKRLDKKAVTEYVEQPRQGDHIWFVADSRKLKDNLHWRPKKWLPQILDELCE